MRIKVSVLGYFTPGIERPDSRLLTPVILKTGGIKIETNLAQLIQLCNTGSFKKKMYLLFKLEKDWMIYLTFTSVIILT